MLALTSKRNLSRCLHGVVWGADFLGICIFGPVRVQGTIWYDDGVVLQSSPCSGKATLAAVGRPWRSMLALGLGQLGPRNEYGLRNHAAPEEHIG